jgi:hypothetical protein
MLTCMKPRLLRLQKLTNESAWGMGVMLGTAGPGLTSTSPEEQRRIRVRLASMKLESLFHSRIIRQIMFTWVDPKINVHK